MCITAEGLSRPAFAAAAWGAGRSVTALVRTALVGTSGLAWGSVLAPDRLDRWRRAAEAGRTGRPARVAASPMARLASNTRVATALLVIHRVLPWELTCNGCIGSGVISPTSDSMLR